MSIVCLSERLACAELDHARGQKFAPLAEDRIGGGFDKMRVDRLEAAQRIEVKRAGLDGFDVAGL